jgi:hypothetical protein
MTRPAAIPVVPRKRGNPNWGRPIPPAPVLATEFEMQVRELHLKPEGMSFRLNSAPGLSGTEIGAISQNGC